MKIPCVKGENLLSPQPTTIAMVIDRNEATAYAATERASHFIWELHCGRKDRKLFKRTMWTLVKMINTTGDLALITDGERRYGHVVFDLGSEVIRTGKRGRPPRILPKGV